MLHPQGFYPQGLNPFFPQGLNSSYPQGLSPQGLSPQGLSPQGLSPQGFYPQGTAQGGAGYFANTPGYFANTLYGLPQHALVQSSSPPANWQQPVQQGIQQATWPQHNNLGQINPTLQQQWTQPPSFQQLAQHHYAIAQQLLQLAAQQTLQGSASPYAGQFIPGAMGGSFVPGVTMH
jgi:hypothetical protein